MKSNESLVPHNDTPPRYIVVTDQESGNRTASVHIGDETYSVVIPAELDRDTILADRRRSSRASFIEELMDGPLQESALVNRTIQLVAFDAYDAGEIPKTAWDEFRVASTLVHFELLDENRRSSQLGSVAITRLNQG